MAFAVLAICVALIVFLIAVVRIHAFLALVLVSITAGLLAAPGRLPGERPERVELSGAPLQLKGPAGGRLELAPAPPETPPASLVTNVTVRQPPRRTVSHGILAVNLTLEALGATAGKIAVVIALASIIGMGLMESGAADKVVRRFLAFFGEKRAGGAILFSGYFLSIPIFFDTFFMLLLPLARALALRTRTNYLLYVLAIGAGASVTHSLIIPHPGPLAMADMLHIDPGLSIMVGLGVGLIPIALTWQVAKWICRRAEVPVREVPGSSLEDLRKLMDKPEGELPGFFASVAPVLLPILLISAASVVKASPSWKAAWPSFTPVLLFVGDRNIALLLGAALALNLVMRQKGISFRQLSPLLGPPLETAGMIILITSAGGAFGTMLRNAGVGDAVKAAAEGAPVNLIFLAWLVAAVIRVAQGSATVSMMTAAAMMTPLLGAGLPYHPIYIFMAIGFGAMILSWMNDSGFWVVCKLSGLTEQETLKSWTVVATANSVFGLLACLVLSKIFPGT
ncbi:MAG: hypothetical protein J7M29_09980 [Verrucomicrobia bacterium]|nr:hypothetical protein [Verrucomicrobiota bacterium]